jgi:CubicO group peptidase (beta-lactamase class C family)
MLCTALPRTSAAIEAGLGSVHVGVQIFVSVRGRVVADAALGLARPDVAMSTTTLMPWMSCTKLVTATAFALVWDRGLVGLDAPVSRYVPDFEAGGKGGITLRHLLTHTAGLLPAEQALGPVRYQQSFGDNVALICQTPADPTWPPGGRAAYLTTSAMLMIAEVIRRVDGRPFDAFVRQELFGPLGMDDCWVGMPRERHRAYGDRIGVMYDTSGERPKQPSAWAPNGEDELTAIIPGGNGRGPVRELARVLELLLGEGRRDGVELLRPTTVAALTARHRTGLPVENWGRPLLDWGLGLMLDSKRACGGPHFYGYGAHASPRAFGHAGFLSSVAFADPDAGLAVALVWNGMPADHAVHTRRQNETCTAIYEDLGLGS